MVVSASPQCHPTGSVCVPPQCHTLFPRQLRVPQHHPLSGTGSRAHMVTSSSRSVPRPPSFTPPRVGSGSLSVTPSPGVSSVLPQYHHHHHHPGSVSHLPRWPPRASRGVGVPPTAHQLRWGGGCARNPLAGMEDLGNSGEVKCPGCCSPQRQGCSASEMPELPFSCCCC